MKITRYIHRPNLTELGLGNTNETYLLISGNTNVSSIFPSDVEVPVVEAVTKRVYLLKAKDSTREFRVNQLGQLYRDFDMKPGDELYFTCFEGSQRSVFVDIKQYPRVVLYTGGNGSEIANIERLAPFKVADRKYAISTNIGAIEISFLQSKKKRNDSPEQTDFYYVTSNGSPIGYGTLYIELGEKNTVSTLQKAEISSYEVQTNDIQSPVTIPSTSGWNKIYYGAPGTGKSYAVKKIVERNKYIRTIFHPDSDYSSFVGCYKPIKSGDKISYEFRPQAFIEAYVKSWLTNEPYYLVIEEINRGNCAQIFGDIFQLLDRTNGVSDYEIQPDLDLQKYLCETFMKPENQDLIRNRIETIPENVLSGEVMILPHNLNIVATMNTSDQSLFPMDSAFKRRWEWKYFSIKDEGKQFQIQLSELGSTFDWWKTINAINTKIYNTTKSADKQIGYWFAKLPEGETIIDGETFVSKVIFYLWNDVFKDYGFGDNNVFTPETTFDKFYDSNGNIIESVVELFMDRNYPKESTSES